MGKTYRKEDKERKKKEQIQRDNERKRKQNIKQGENDE